MERENLYLANVLNRFSTDLSRYSSISPNSLKSSNPTPTEINKRYTKLKTQLESLINEKKSLEKTMDLGHGNKSKAQLWKLRSNLEQKLKLLTDENEALKRFNSETWTKSDTEVIQMKKDMKILEKEREEQINLVSLIKEPEFFEKCLKDPGLFERAVEERKKNKVRKMEKHLKILEKHIKTNRNKFAQEYKGLMEYEKRLESDKMCLQVKALKISQKQRLLEISEKGLSPNEGRLKSYSKVGFLFKPSINELYN